MKLKRLLGRRFLVDRRMQLGVTGLLLLPLLTQWLVFFLAFRSSLDTAFTRAIEAESAGAQVSSELRTLVLDQFQSYFFANFALTLALGAILGILVTNRIAGPLYRLKGMLADGRTGSNVRFRKSDYFKELGPLLSDLEKKKSEEPGPE